MDYTLNDYHQGRCTLDQVGQEIPTTMPMVQSAKPQDFITEWMEVYKDIGGRGALATFARENPAKFYDQLHKLLVSMEAPKATMKMAQALDRLSMTELESLPTNELKRRLLAGMAAGMVVEGELVKEKGTM